MQVGQVPPDLDPAALQAEVADQLTFYWGMPLEQFELSVAMDELTEAVRRFHIALPPAVTVLIKVLVMLEGTARLLDPKFNLTGVLEQYRGQFTRRRLSPRRVLGRLASGIRDWEEVIGSLPRLMRDVMRFAREKKFAVQLQHQHLEPSVNRLVLGLLASALFVGSAFLWAQKAPPHLWDVSVFGVIGCAVSAVMAARLFWAIQKSGKLED
jgi:ubiquinone biosynthesis protein